MRISAAITGFYHRIALAMCLLSSYSSVLSLTVRGAIMSLIFSLHTSAGFLSKFGHFQMLDVSPTLGSVQVEVMDVLVVV